MSTIYRPRWGEGEYRELVEDAKAATIPYAMLLAGQAAVNNTRSAPHTAALLAILIAQASGGDPRAAAEVAWNAAWAFFPVEKDAAPHPRGVAA